MAKFIHTSDWHLVNSFTLFDRETRQKLNQARFLAVETIFIYAQKQGISLILNAGDTFDNGQVATDRDLLELFAIVKRYPGIQLVMIAGNHDPLLSNSVYRKVMKENFPSNLTLVDSGQQVLPVPEMKMNIYAASLLEKNGNYNPLAWLETTPPDQETLAVGLAHGSVRLGDQRFGANAFPIDPAFASSVKLDYLALGDWHSYKKINDHTYYCGTLEPLGFDMVGYALEVDIPGKGAEPKVKKINNISQYQWLKESLEINDEKLASFKKSMESSMDRKVTGLSLSGYLSLAKYREYREFRDYLEMVGGPKTTLILNDAVALAPSEAELADIGSGPVRDIISQLLQYKKNEEPLPGDILNNLLRGDQLHLEDELNIKNEEIIDRALLKLYTYYSTAKQEPGVSK